MPDAVPEQLAHQQSGVIRHGCPGPGTPAVNARATRARSARPATVTLSRTTALATSAPAFPARPAAREITRDRGRAHGHARSARRPGPSRKHAVGAARPWPSVEKPTVRTDRPDGPDAVRYTSVDTATHRLTVTHADTGRDKRETARLAENSQLAGRFRR
jgi:hypothetical protein